MVTVNTSPLILRLALAVSGSAVGSFRGAPYLLRLAFPRSWLWAQLLEILLYVDQLYSRRQRR
jgi:hypothetical protein